jgi:hypothetical protein
VIQVILNESEYRLAICKEVGAALSDCENLDSDVQGDFESCAHILTSDRTSQYVTFEPIMPYTNADTFREKRTKSFSKKGWEPLNFVKKMDQKSHGRLFLLSFSSKLGYFNKNLNLNHKWLSLTWRKPIWF